MNMMPATEKAPPANAETQKVDTEAGDRCTIDAKNWNGKSVGDGGDAVDTGGHGNDTPQQVLRAEISGSFPVTDRGGRVKVAKGAEEGIRLRLRLGVSVPVSMKQVAEEKKKGRVGRRFLFVFCAL